MKTAHIAKTLQRNETAQKGQFLNHVLENEVRLSLYQSDITDERVDAIVNATNEWLQHCAGVGAAIVRKGGRQIEDESRRIISQRNRLPLSVGDAVYTTAGNLPCRFVVHTVGPRWSSLDRKKCTSLLYRACMESLCLVAKLELCSIALPPISSGIFGMPKDTCAQVMFEALEQFSSSVEAEFSTLRDVRIVIIDYETISVFQEAFVKRYTLQAMAEKPNTERIANGMQRKGKGLKAPTSVKSSDETSKTTATKAPGRPGREVCAITFPQRYNVEEGPKAKGSTRLHLEHGANVRTPPCLVVKDEGRRLAQTDFSELVNDDQNCPTVIQETKQNDTTSKATAAKPPGRL